MHSCDCMSHLCPADELHGDSYVAAEWDNDLTRRLDFWHTKFPFASRFQRRLQVKHILHQGPGKTKNRVGENYGFSNELQKNHGRRRRSRSWAVTKSKLKPSPAKSFVVKSSTSAHRSPLNILHTLTDVRVFDWPHGQHARYIVSDGKLH